MPKEVKARIVLFYRHRRHQRRLKCFTAAVVVVALLGFVLLSLVLMGWYSLRVSLFLGLGYLGVVFLIDKAGVEYGL
jgi:predicted membrane channel-forming protein YqfA (hemolysin III family)